MDTPLIFTSKGNLPIDELEYTPSWQFNRGEDGVVLSIVFSEEYKDSVGDIVKRNAHVYDCHGTVATGKAADIGG